MTPTEVQIAKVQAPTHTVHSEHVHDPVQERACDTPLPLTLIPLLGRPIELVLAAWSLLAVLVAVRQGLDVNTAWAALISVVGWLVIQIAIGFVQALLG